MAMSGRGTGGQRLRALALLMACIVASASPSVQPDKPSEGGRASWLMTRNPSLDPSGGSRSKAEKQSLRYYAIQGSCFQACGSDAGTCWCDEICHRFGDCCPDKCNYCNTPNCNNASVPSGTNTTGTGDIKEVCGDGILSDSEACDDGNTIDGDACSSDCSARNDDIYNCSDPIFSGIQLNYSIDNLRHCELCLDIEYGQGQSSRDIEGCKSREYMVFAAKPPVSSNTSGRELTLAAIFRSNSFNKTTSYSQATGPEFGTWRYYVSGWSVGFAPSSSIDLRSADTWDSDLHPISPSQSDCQYRLSWHMNLGGWRAGCTVWLNFDQQWRKQIYSCPQAWSCRPIKEKCMLTATWDEIIPQLSGNSSRYVAGGMGTLMEIGVKETWVCEYGHKCAPQGDAMCFVYDEENKVFNMWGLMSVLQLVPYGRP